MTSGPPQSSVQQQTLRADHRADEGADRWAWIVVIGFLLLSLLIEGSTKQMEALRPNSSASVAAGWLEEVSSHLALLFIAPLIPIWLNRFPLLSGGRLRNGPAYVLGFLLFTVAHVLLMVMIRHGLWTQVVGGDYAVALFRLEPWLYEARKDVFTYLAMLGVFIAARHMALLSEERRAARDEARGTGRLTLKVGGRQIMIEAAQVVRASAAGNYVELYTLQGHHFIRLTLTELETLLRDAGVDAVRIHRSHLVCRDHLREVGPRRVMTADGCELPVGRSYKDTLLQP